MKRYQLKRFQFVPFDCDEYDREKVAYTIDELYSDDVYLTDDKDFFDKYYESKKFQPKTEMNVSVEIEFDESDLETIKRLYEVTHESKKIESIYIREQHFGGHEEGGWYYHTMRLVLNSEDVEIGTDQYGEGYILCKEFYEGENENLRNQYYC